MGKQQRDKGKRWEQQVSRAFTEAGIDAQRRGYTQSQDNTEADVMAYPFWVECKATAAPVQWRRAMDQALADCPPYMVPVVVGKQNRRTPEVAVSLYDLAIILHDTDYPSEVDLVRMDLGAFLSIAARWKGGGFEG